MEASETGNTGLIRLAKVVSDLGGPCAFGRRLGVSHEAVRKWLNGGNRITGERAREIEDKTDAAITRYELRPDLFGAAPADQPATQEAA